MTRRGGSRVGTHVGARGAIGARFALHTGRSGLVVGVNRDNVPIALQVFRPEPTLVAAISSLAFTQIIAFRAMAVGAHVAIKTNRPARWEIFGAIEATLPGSATLLDPVGVSNEVGTPYRPLLIVQDQGGNVGSTVDLASTSPWSATLTLVEDLTRWSLPIAANAHHLLMQPLTTYEASLVGGIPGLEGPARYLGNIREDMLGVFSGKQFRWGLLVPTQTEKQTFGLPVRA